MQAPRLLHGALGLARGLQLVALHGLRLEEAERVEVRAPDPVPFNHGIGAARAQAQRRVLVAHSVLVRAVGHGPLVQPEAVERAGLPGRVRQDLACELHRRLTLGQESVRIHDDAARGLPYSHGGGQLRGGGGAVELPVRTLRGVEQDDPGARVPAGELRGGERVVGEEEVLHGVLLPAGTALQERLRPAGDPVLVGPFPPGPLLPAEDLTHGCRPPRSPVRWRSAGASPR